MARSLSTATSSKGSSAGKSLLIIRHAQSAANVKGILAGRIDPTPLTVKGRREARALTPLVESFDPEISLVSPLLRCRQTSELAGSPNVQIDERLIEMDYGTWSGRSLKLLSRRPEWKRIQRDPENFTFPRGESFRGATHRILDLLAEINERAERRFLLFSHGDICRILINTLIGRSFNDFQKILIEPASHSLLILPGGLKATKIQAGATVAYLNRLPLEKEGSKVAKKFTLGGE
jgi:broad specificity phosphatase PhoE